MPDKFVCKNGNVNGYEYKLSICIITMNRCEQLTEAINSCLACTLPEKTEFVVVDNASTDDTKEKITLLLENSGYHFVYKKLNENIGVGPGRNTAFELASGQYAYFLDDDAVISEECYNTFFTGTLDYMDSNNSVVSLTTKAYDLAWKCDRTPSLAKSGEIDGCRQIFMYHGYSHFLRNGFFPHPLYLNLKYGYEELSTSILTYNKGYRHVWTDSVRVIHKPKIDKWKKGTDSSRKINILDCSIPYAVKKMLYPTAFYPLLKAAFVMRMKKHLNGDNAAKAECKKTAADTYKNFKNCLPKKIKFSTVISLYKQFGMTVW